MHGTGLPLATPFTAAGDLDLAALRDLVGWVEARGIDFIVPCGSNSEAPLLTPDERALVVETVCGAASVPVVAGTGFPGFDATREATELAADVGADGALVVTPHYFTHDQATLAAYYRDLADDAPIPIYLYSVPKYTGMSLAPETVGDLAAHEAIVGIKDSSGDLATLQRTLAATPEDFAVLCGSGGVYAHALDAGAVGGVLALANVVPEYASAVYERHADDPEAARELNRRLVDLNRAITAEYGIAGLKAAMRARGAPAGHPRRPHRPLDHDARRAVEALVEDVEAALA
jgi:4-hydroxy-tetrahydrodipicolinate synthase